ncbi:MAG: acetyl-CoA carboxylase biotin carboxyl carrier protein [Rhodobacteraceae bacterium HLUCCA12]|nr:MAG: acetyl-CoA carboxylase biotin carboxyl carrier protein [Rhodobacteraceae bacterium HLUCCA12]
MTSKFEILSEADIDKIRNLVEILEKSSFDNLTLELNDIKLTVGSGNAPQSMPQPAAPAPVPIEHGSTADATLPAANAMPAPAAPNPVAPEGLIDVMAPTMGHFYARPDPHSAPYVSVGTQVDSDSTVGLLEVMKLFNSVTAGVAGVVDEIYVSDSELVEYGQVLMRIRPSE